MHYVVKYKIYFHSLSKEVENKLSIENGIRFFDGEMNRNVYTEKDACDYVRTLHKNGEIRKLYDIPDDIYSFSDEGDTGASTIKILRSWIGS